MAKILLNIRIDEALRERLKVLAAAQNRTLSNYVETELRRVADAGGDAGWAELERAFLDERNADQVAEILKVFVSEVSSAVEGKTAAEIAADPTLERDANWLKKARAALSASGKG